jgi:hypothetical protein
MTRADSSHPAVRRRRAKDRAPVAPAAVLGDVAPSSEFDEWADRVLRQPALRQASSRGVPAPPDELTIPIPDRVARSLGLSKEFEFVLEFPARRLPLVERGAKSREPLDPSEPHRARHPLH